MAFTDIVFNTIVSLLYQTGYLGVFLLMVAESATLPIPSEVVLPLGGYLVSQGRLEFWSTVAVATVGSLVGTMVDYGIGYYLGRPAVLRYGRIVRFSEKRLETTEKWFGSHGKSVVLLARFVPLLRTLIAFPAGLVKMDVKRFTSIFTSPAGNAISVRSSGTKRASRTTLFPCDPNHFSVVSNRFSLNRTIRPYRRTAGLPR